MKLNRNSNIFSQENAFENFVWKMTAILFRPQCVNSIYQIMCTYSAADRLSRWHYPRLILSKTLEFITKYQRLGQYYVGFIINIVEVPDERTRIYLKRSVIAWSKFMFVVIIFVEIYSRIRLSHIYSFSYNFVSWLKFNNGHRLTFSLVSIRPSSRMFLNSTMFTHHFQMTKQWP